MEVTGKIKLIEETRVVSDKFKVRNIVLTTDEKYPQHLSVQFAQDKCELLDKFKPGDDVQIGINLRGREWINPQGEAKYFNTIEGWIIKSVGQAEEVVNESLDTEDDDLPF